jgi:hypothetical protein
MDLNEQRFCSPYLNAQMVKLLAIHDNVAQMANYVAQMSQLLAIQDKQHTILVCMSNSNGAGADTLEQNSHDAGSDLFQAASSGNVSMVQALLSATGAQSYINYTDGHGRTSLFKAACNGHITIVVHLMAARCSINLATVTGSTPFLVAVRKGHAALVSHLNVKCVLLPLKLSVDQSNRPYDLKKHLFCHAPGSSVLGSPRSSAYRDVCVQASTSRLPELTPLTMHRAVPSVPPPLDSSMVDYTNAH